MRKYYTISQAYRTIGLIVIVLSVLFYLLVTPDERDTIQETIIDKARLRDALKNILPGETTENINTDDYPDIYDELSDGIDLPILIEEYEEFVANIKGSMAALPACIANANENCLGEKKYNLINIKRAEMTSNCFYSGGLLNDKKHGPGITVCDDNIFEYAYYTNDYANGVVYAFETESDDNSTFISMHNKIDDLFNGQGFEISFDSQTEKIKYIYQGGFKHDLYSGYGTQLTSESIYKGEWKKGLYNGQGQIWLVESDISYQGAFLNGYYSGFGIWQNRDNYGRNIYHGNLEFNLSQGNGTIIWGNGTQYTGSWDKDWFHGQGKFSYSEEEPGSDGEKSESGNWNHGLLEDTDARIEYFDGRVYVGGYSQYSFHGPGLMINADGSSIRGNYSYGIRHGERITKDKNGTFFESYNYDIPHGAFKEIYNNGQTWSYVMENGLIVGSKRVVTEDGKIYDCDSHMKNCKQIN